MTASAEAAVVAVVCMASFAGKAVAQPQVVVQGRVIERGEATAIVRATVEIAGLRTAETADNGGFRFERVAPGEYTLHVAAFGYVSRDLRLVVERDTVLTIELDPAPVELDTLAVEGRTITIRGRVMGTELEQGLTRAEVRTSVNRETRTNSAGSFRLRDIPAGPPVLLMVRAFGYLPYDTTITALEDIDLRIRLEVDPLMARMIDHQVERLEERSRPFRSSIMPVIDRTQLLRRANGNLLDVVKAEYSINLDRVKCILIDDQQSYNGMEELALILPTEVERVEVLERGAMLRIYTRSFIQRMVGGGVALARPVYVSFARPPFCR